jgi:hypothetical protein
LACIPAAGNFSAGEGKMNKYWTIVLPGALIAVIYYAYSSPGFVSRKVQAIVDPLLRFGHAIVNFIFGV